MPEGFLPPWLQQGADPAAATAQGMQIGQRDSEMALQQQQQAEMMKEHAFQNQQLLQSQAMEKQRFQLQAKAAADKAAAVLSYQNALRGGTDPLQAILQYGPAMGQQASPEAAAMRALAMQPKLPPPAPKFVPENPETGEPAHYLSGGKVTFLPKAAPDISSSERAQTLKALADEEKELLENNPLLLEKARKMPDKLTLDEQAVISQWNSIRAQRAELLPRLNQVPRGTTGGEGTAPPPGNQPLKFVRDASGRLVPEGAAPAGVTAASADIGIPGLPEPSYDPQAGAKAHEKEITGNEVQDYRKFYQKLKAMPPDSEEYQTLYERFKNTLASVPADQRTAILAP